MSLFLGMLVMHSPSPQKFQGVLLKWGQKSCLRLPLLFPVFSVNTEAAPVEAAQAQALAALA